MNQDFMSQHEFLKRLTTWLVKNRPSLDPETVTWEADLIDSRIIDSLLFVEFVLFLEDVVGVDVGQALNSLNNFRTPELTYEMLRGIKQSACA